jgi:hypothetical protein
MEDLLQFRAGYDDNKRVNDEDDTDVTLPVIDVEAEEEEKEKQEEESSGSEAESRSRNPKARQPVEQLDITTKEVLRRYPSQGAAMDAMHGTQALLSACVRGLKAAAYGFAWRTYSGPPIDCKLFRHYHWY